MALYGYKCEDCGQEADFFFKMGEAPAKFSHPGKCVSVTGETTEHSFLRVYSSFAIQPEGSSGDGYFLDSKSGLSSKGRPKDKRWV